MLILQYRTLNRQINILIFGKIFNFLILYVNLLSIETEELEQKSVCKNLMYQDCQVVYVRVL